MIKHNEGNKIENKSGLKETWIFVTVPVLASLI